MKQIFLTFAMTLWAAVAIAEDNTLVIETGGATKGTIVIELRPDLAPKHVEQIKTLARAKFYDGVAFHRVIDGFMAQTGDGHHALYSTYNPARAGTGGSSLPNIAAEFSDVPFLRGTVGMARSASPDSANSQFFIMFAPAPHLNGQYSVIGQVKSGQDIVDALKRGDNNKGGVVPDTPDYMAKVYIKGDQ